MAEVRFWAFREVFRASSHWQPAVDLGEDKDAYHVIVELAGIDKDQVSVEYLTEERTLRIRGLRKPILSGTNQLLILELNYGPFQRDIPLPGPVNDDEITAQIKNGILHIVVPKRIPTRKGYQDPSSKEEGGRGQ
ncbi:MAG: Hsp20/alpha crystallin family protein [Armatimonadetes bacterium]|nr:Hsp20/alpha crystallin family protein [Armatimonadota bacterium]MDW8122955.1 Hsp20/alpha crystallin family protein [Armatimonadota bacterium]